MNRMVVLFILLVFLTAGCVEDSVEIPAGSSATTTLEIATESSVLVANTVQNPGSDGYLPGIVFENPTGISAENTGPGGCTSLLDCVRQCEKNLTLECRDWLQAVYLELDTERQIETEKHKGVWMPTIDSLRRGAMDIPKLKELGVNTVSFGPEIDTRHFDGPKVVGGNAYRFYAKIFEDAGFNVHLVPNPMHWGNNEVELRRLNSILLEWAEEAERLDVKFYTLFNEFDNMAQGNGDASEWIGEVLPGVRERYSGLICVQPTQPAFFDTDEPEKQKIDYSGLDCVSSFYPLLINDQEHYKRHVDAFTGEAESIRKKYPSVKYVMFNDVSAFYGDNWAETGLMEAEKWGYFKVYVTEDQQALLLNNFLEDVYPKTNGTFFNTWKGFTFMGREAEEVVGSKYSEGGRIPVTEKDYAWATSGFLKLMEKASMDEEEREFIFDLETYSGETVGCAGLCFEPGPDEPGPFGCVSTEGCMKKFKENPEEYWWWRVEKCS